MSDLIDRQDALDAVDRVTESYNSVEAMKICAEARLELLTLPPKEPKKGRWDLHKSGALFICSACGETSLRTERYCPNCGTKMEVTE